MRQLLFLTCLFCLSTWSVAGDPVIIPRPVSMKLEKGWFPINSAVSIAISERGLKKEAGFLRDALTPLLAEPPLVLPMSGLEPSMILLSMDRGSDLPPGGYRLNITPENVEVLGVDEAGVFHAIQTLIQLLHSDPKAGFPCLTIIDHPRFAWRGMHLDVSRHFFSIEFVKRYIDLMARYKMNTFHWHLTDDQGWRIEIKKYPELTAVGGWRNGSQVGPYAAQTFDTSRYGGFYTQEEIREVVAYADRRHITIVPEIEMPGHALAALAAYPELSCSGGPFEVAKGWGVFEDVFCPTEPTFAFLEGVLDEVIGLFPGKYIHIGGDECPKERWKACAKCQERMKEEGLKDEHELQSYFIQRIERYVNAKGRMIIGWDEILEGGLAPNAAVMSWRGTEGGVAAAKAGHDVVMCPGSHCYFDHYQGDPANEPLAIGGYTTVQKVYAYEPVPSELGPAEAKHILGAQGNVWTEYILTPDHVEYMAVPRMLALAEVLWTPKEKRDEADFMRRLEAEFPRLEAMGVNASKSLYQISIRPKQGQKLGSIAVEMTSSTGGSFSMTEMPPPFDEMNAQLGVYTAPVIIASDRELWGWLQNEEITGPISKRRFHFNKATAQKINLSNPPNERYNEGGAFTLVDGISGSDRRVNTEWLGWKEDVVITVDLGSEQEIGYIGIGALGDTHSWIHLPRKVVIGTSPDGQHFEEYAELMPEETATGRVQLGRTGAVNARFIQVSVRSAGKIPEGFPGAGSPAWLFLDEIEVR